MTAPAKVADVLRASAASIAREWSSRCGSASDPELPPVSDAMRQAVVEALVAMITAPTSPDVIEAYAASIDVAEIALAELFILREVLRERVSDVVGVDAAATRVVEQLVDDAALVAVQRIATDLAQVAVTDHLTGLGNRRAFDSDLVVEAARAARYERRLSIVVIDLDGLKAVNDRYGHTAGDHRLRALAGAVRRSLRAGDTAYRVGGDEFVVMLPEATRHDVDAIMRRVAKSGAPPFSLGVASYPDDAPDELVRLADDRMFAGRQLRRG